MASANSSLSIAAVKRHSWSASDISSPIRDCAICAANATSAGIDISGDGSDSTWVDDADVDGAISAWGASLVSFPPHATHAKNTNAITGDKSFDVLNAICSLIKVLGFLNHVKAFFSFWEKTRE
jgi:hypothetical protein